MLTNEFQGLRACVLDDALVALMLKDVGFSVTDITLRNPEQIAALVLDYDLYVFTGGADVSPELYGEDPLPATYMNPVRDNLEQAFFRRLPATAPKAGICRGGQFLNVLSGGKMWQDVDNHCRDHVLYDLTTDNAYRVTSTHHQMMRPSSSAALIAVAAESSAKEAMDHTMIVGKGDERLAEPYDTDVIDVEVVYYPNTTSLCFQPHPEYEAHRTDTRRYFLELLHRQFGEAFKSRSSYYHQPLAA